MSSVNRLLNDRPNRIYRNGRPVEPGEAFESEGAYDDENFPAAPDRPAVGEEPHEVTGREDRSSVLNDAEQGMIENRRALASESTARLRDPILPDGHADRGAGSHLKQNQPTTGVEAVPPPHDPSPDVEVESAADPLSKTLHEQAAEDEDRAEQVKSVHGESADDVEASQAAQDAADELGVDLAEVEGTGKDGSVTVKDVRKHAKGDE
jgi:pyruvate/2-oxoglutarate dehydrogenase complex dihydrolipoamide acyltransferase (E2) component